MIISYRKQDIIDLIITRKGRHSLRRWEFSGNLRALRAPSSPSNLIIPHTKGGTLMAIEYKKFEPTEYVMKVKRGRIVQEGLGLSLSFFSSS